MKLQHLILPALLLLPAAKASDDDGLLWLDNYNTAIQEARRTNRPIFLEFRCEP
jgi:hypothetical protein